MVRSSDEPVNSSPNEQVQVPDPSALARVVTPPQVGGGGVVVVVVGFAVVVVVGFLVVVVVAFFVVVVVPHHGAAPAAVVAMAHEQPARGGQLREVLPAAWCSRLPPGSSCPRRW